MKNLLSSVLLIVLFSSLSFGQLGSASFNSNILVHSQGLPNEFLLFVPDTATQILFNPARANDYSSSFVYATYEADYKGNYYLPLRSITDLVYSSSSLTIPDMIPLPLISAADYTEIYGAGKNPTVAVATLFNAFDAKWLFLFTNGLSKSTGTSDYNSATNTIDNYYQTNSSSFSSQTEFESKYVTTSFQLSKIFSSGMGKGSIGLFATFNTDFNNSISDNSNSTRNISGVTTIYTNSNDRIQRTKSDVDNSGYTLGFEFTAANDNWDYIARASYHKSTYEWRNSYYSNDKSNDSTYNVTSVPPSLSTYKSDRTNRNTGYNESNPYMLSFENYYQHKTTLLGLEGNLFVSANAFYSKGEGKIYSSSSSGYAYYSNGLLSSKDSTNSLTDGKSDRNDWGFAFTPGYLLKKSFSDLFLMTGISMNTGYNKLTTNQTNYTTSSSNPTSYTTTSKVRFFILTIPVYINYSPAEWISVWGGMNYSYGYNKSETESLSNTLYLSNPYTSLGKMNNSNSGYQSRKSTFLGLELNHPSGLRVQIAFDEDVASFRDWNISVGYHF